MSICFQCPASMCPLFAKDGSPWTSEKDAPCPSKGYDNDDGCPWWDMACSVGGIQNEVEEAAKHGGYAGIQLGPNGQKRGPSAPREYDCPKASVCQWQNQATIAGRELCPPRDAMARGIDPRVCAL